MLMGIFRLAAISGFLMLRHVQTPCPSYAKNAYLLRFVYVFLFHFVVRVLFVVVYSKRQCYSEIHFVELKTEQNKYIISCAKCQCVVCVHRLI